VMESRTQLMLASYDVDGAGVVGAGVVPGVVPGVMVGNFVGDGVCVSCGGVQVGFASWGVQLGVCRSSAVKLLVYTFRW
jgi:hypothetical protein